MILSSKMHIQGGLVEVMAFRGLSATQYDNLFVFLQPQPEYVVDALNNGIYK